MHKHKRKIVLFAGLWISHSKFDRPCTCCLHWAPQLFRPALPTVRVHSTASNSWKNGSAFHVSSRILAITNHSRQVW